MESLAMSGRGTYGLRSPARLAKYRGCFKSIYEVGKWRYYKQTITRQVAMVAAIKNGDVLSLI